ncbi:MAG TPA: biotin/lipoyl-binding protein [Thermoflexales bacterium]|nr:biotin/lipoyl-binding protein [Thermoflexales bacterium]HQX09245.1 biotin/lipoyl-binding protein [Thermoflexales bacterium]HQY24135.1 biotin/lipoyl-binding protein [Thermoflexales bacterium]HQZ52427.1 biotin/lipoyl-binding protein [Thermoflexales bacterium]
MRNIRRLFLPLLAGMLVLGACSVQNPFATGDRGAASATPAPTVVPLPTAVLVSRATVAVDGALALALPATQLGFETTGRVIEVNAVPGTKVKKGVVLARLDDVALQDALAQAREQLGLVEARQAQAAAPATARQPDVDSAKASLNAAYAAYTDLTKRPTQSGIEQALRSWNQAKNQLWSAQIARDSACALSREAIACKTNEASVGAAFEAERGAYQRYLDAQRGATAQELAQAYSSIASADARLKQLTEPVTQTVEQRQLAATELSQAKSAVARAERNLSRAALLSPCDCTVQDVTIAVGSAASSAPAFVLAQTSALVFRSSNLSERDLAAIRVGAAATLRLKPFDRTFTGRVSAILPQASGTQGNAAIFTIVIDVDPADALLDAELLPGMTGQAEITAR